VFLNAPNSGIRQGQWTMSFLLSRKSGHSVLVRWAAGGWAFFIAENAILSENRTWLIRELGDGNYHNVYGTLSTVATASIGFAYYKIRKGTTTMPQRWILWRRSPGPVAAFGSWIVLTTGLIMASQVAPRMQVPVTMTTPTSGGGSGIGPGGAVGFQVRCPFDFSDKQSTGAVRGLDRVSRHPGLWSLGFIGLGQSILSPTVPLRIWWL
jgi:hypothetical protein